MPWRTVDNLELATLSRVPGNTIWLHSSLQHVAPIELGGQHRRSTTTEQQPLSA